MPGDVVILVKCHGSHSKDRKDTYNDKYVGKTMTKTDKDKNFGECRMTVKYSNRLQRHPVSIYSNLEYTSSNSCHYSQASSLLKRS